MSFTKTGHPGARSAQASPGLDSPSLGERRLCLGQDMSLAVTAFISQRQVPDLLGKDFPWFSVPGRWLCAKR